MSVAPHVPLDLPAMATPPMTDRHECPGRLRERSPRANLALQIAIELLPRCRVTEDLGFDLAQGLCFQGSACDRGGIGILELRRQFSDDVVIERRSPGEPSPYKIPKLRRNQD